MKKDILTKIFILLSIISLVSCSTISNSSTDVINISDPLWQGSPSTIWEKIQPNSTTKLLALRKTMTDPQRLAWIDLALISKQRNSDEFAQALLTWQANNPSHPANHLLPNTQTLEAMQTMQTPHQIALLLPQSGIYTSSGQAIRQGFFHAYYANVTKADKQIIKLYDTARTTNIAKLYNQAVAEGADFVIGPLTKENVQQLSQLGKFTVPTLALNYSTGSLPANYYEFGLLPEDEATQLANHARAQGLNHAIIIAPDNAWGRRLVDGFDKQWQSVGGNIQEIRYFAENGNLNQLIAELLHVNPEAKDKSQQHRQDFDVIFLFTKPSEAETIVPLLHSYANDIPIYASSSVYSGKFNFTINAALNGIIICDIPQMRGISSKESVTNRLFAVGEDAYLLSNAMPRITHVSNFPVYGATGALILSPAQQIHRRVPCAMVSNGVL